jgi:small subunit ribosomal protein S18
MSEISTPPRRESRDRDSRDRDSRDRDSRDRDSRPPSGDRPRPSGPRSRPGDDERRGAWSVKARLRARARKKARKGKKQMFQRRKVCRFCADKKLLLDYKEPKTLRLFVSETGKVTPRRISGTCAKHQRKLTLQIKRARQIALLPYAPKHI